MIKEIEYPSYFASNGPVASVSWGAVFAGTFVTIATMIALSLLGAGIGLASTPAAGSAAGLMKGLGIGTVVWLFISGILSYYAGGWIAGRLTRAGIVSESVIHSVVTWAFATTAFMFMLTSAIGGTLGGAANLIGQSARTAADSGAAYASRSPQSAAQLTEEARGAVSRLAQQAQANAPSQQEVIQKAETGAQAAGAAGIAGFFLLLVEALACAAGGRAGTRLLKPRTLNAVRPRETASVS